jgi:hypothetical protein
MFDFPLTNVGEIIASNLKFGRMPQSAVCTLEQNWDMKMACISCATVKKKKATFHKPTVFGAQKYRLEGADLFVRFCTAVSLISVMICDAFLRLNPTAIDKRNYILRLNVENDRCHTGHYLRYDVNSMAIRYIRHGMCVAHRRRFAQTILSSLLLK